MSDYLLRKTFRDFFSRASEHMVTSNMASKRIKNTKESAISNQLFQCNFPITFNDFDILASDSHNFAKLH